jgi:hypothetical protein
MLGVVGLFQAGESSSALMRARHHHRIVESHDDSRQ